MKLIVQENEMGCGVACVAALLDISYKKADKLFPKSIQGKPKYFCRILVKVLERAGLKYEYKYIKPRLKKKTYISGTVVFIKRSNKYPFGHYLLRVNHRWMDSWINFPSKNRKAGLRRRLPGKPIYAILEKKSFVVV